MNCVNRCLKINPTSRQNFTNAFGQPSTLIRAQCQMQMQPNIFPDNLIIFSIGRLLYFWNFKSEDQESLGCLHLGRGDEGWGGGPWTGGRQGGGSRRYHPAIGFTAASRGDQPARRPRWLVLVIEGKPASSVRRNFFVKFHLVCLWWELRLEEAREYCWWDARLYHWMNICCSNLW